MQAAKIKVGELYAYWRSGSHVTFCVEATVTRKDGSDKATNIIEGYVKEDWKQGSTKPPLLKLDPADLLGPIAEYEELQRRKQAEDDKRKAEQEERIRQSKADRLLLYRFVGVDADKDRAEYRQMFRAHYGSLDISREGQAKLIAKIRELMADWDKGLAVGKPSAKGWPDPAGGGIRKAGPGV